MREEREDLQKELFSKKEPELEDVKRSLPSPTKTGTETGLNQQQLCQLEPEAPERDRVKEEDSTEWNSRAVRRLGGQPCCLSHHGPEMQKVPQKCRNQEPARASKPVPGSRRQAVKIYRNAHWSSSSSLLASSLQCAPPARSKRVGNPCCHSRHDDNPSAQQ